MACSMNNTPFPYRAQRASLSKHGDLTNSVAAYRTTNMCSLFVAKQLTAQEYDTRSLHNAWMFDRRLISELFTANIRHHILIQLKSTKLKDQSTKYIKPIKVVLVRRQE